ncbi:alpha/beta hydrolase [Aquimarina brevivitae]|uniref:Uncharacterized protein n=1 Tax=Aquimarina brevivitae TaxID=323412 RepID=A0A4Q7PGX2_9FLAO|nr:alpha/beta hydrolase-fold protein [Aquimarina brevivitae]RZS99387.1 hypothetical protein EV197_0597 [Aquimarina brevivitae]
MKKSIFFLLLSLLIAPVAQAQAIYESFRSVKLDQTRELKIQLPRNYQRNEDKIYPVILVLDGDYLFEPVAGMVDYFSYWEDMPESIVVGINQRKTRLEDGRYDTAQYLPTGSGANFYEFIGQELMPYINETYRTAPLKIIVGHDYTSNFINYFMFKDNPIFQGYINLSPELAPTMIEKISNVLSKDPKNTWYYLATGANDSDQIKEDVIQLDARIDSLKLQNLNYHFDNFAESTHYTLVGKAIPKALEDFFQMYRPISKKIYRDVILPMEDESRFEYLTNIYKTTEELYGFKRKVRINDFIAISTAVEKTEDWEELEPLGDLAVKEYPDSMLGYYYLGIYYEQIGEPKKALRAYEKGFQKEEIAFLTKDYMLEKATKIKEDFGW